MTALAPGDARPTTIEDEVLAALATVVDPELDEPITDLNFVRSILIDDAGVTVHLRLPTSFCSPNFAYLMASDAQDALRRVDDAGLVRVVLDDHHDSDKINAGLAAEAGYVGTFGVEADEGLDDLREIFVRKAHTAAMERCVSDLLARGEITLDDISHLTVRDLPPGPKKAALMRRRVNAGLSLCPNSHVLVDEDGRPVAADDVAMHLRFARSVRISIEGNGHFCRGLLATRYADDSDCDGRSGPVVTNHRSERSAS
ncbi:iron-sulfur cluster assembly protein [Gordonia sp. ABSL11-1]|uniref:iron-sulfur cluster assembly protein n=1 Tax=Gordonia sp. ABSL11-1 TaxID=3053924 RepID=UPI0025743A07|nr:iron-sulfur cluster assembly protein [Gordonia sp. ABSL11-1]MDL9947924.1 iron-sulfur cluster assembly protein [Gordonia sp. ABSL11-1]